MVRRDQVNRTGNTDHAARTCQRFLYSTVSITRLYDYQTWQTQFVRNSRGAQRFVGFFLDCGFRALIGWAGKLRHTEAMGRESWKIPSKPHEGESWWQIPQVHGPKAASSSNTKVTQVYSGIFTKPSNSVNTQRYSPPLRSTVIVLVYTKPVNNQRQKMNIIWSNLGWKGDTHARVHCRLQTSGYPELE